jgi:hypothetical protein
MKKLPVICPQEYRGASEMVAVPCTRCCNWIKHEQRCDIYMGVEHLDPVAPADVPDCPAAARCQHQIQALPSPCPVRARGYLCESIVGEDHPLAFNAIMFE